MSYVVKMDGEKVRFFSGWDYDKISQWAKIHCHSKKIEIVGLVEGKLPKAGNPHLKPCLDSRHLVYRPFVALT